MRGYGDRDGTGYYQRPHCAAKFDGRRVRYYLNGNFEEALPWLERALQSRRYDSYHYPHYNLGRVYMAKEMYVKARHHFEQALQICPEYNLARNGLQQVRRKLH